jgi:helix-turn-helix protein
MLDMFLTIEEAAQLARVSGRTLRRWLATGRLPYHQASALISIPIIYCEKARR